jgi:serine/threonine protein kinase
MGEVYRARDTRLGRTVAIKVLPPQLSADIEFRERFEREARVISKLSHPHICALYDIGAQDGLHYLVMEFLEGENLAERLKKGRCPLPEALRIAGEIAEARECAHRSGITHRDLKKIRLDKWGICKPGCPRALRNRPDRPSCGLAPQGFRADRKSWAALRRKLFRDPPSERNRVWQTDFSEFETPSGGIWRICA